MLLGTYSPDAHRGIARFGAENGWHLHADMARIPVVPESWRGDGIVAGLGEWDDPVTFLQHPAVRRIPTVDIYCMRPAVALPRVVGDHFAVGQLAAEHLLGAGWRRFAWFSRVDHAVARVRLEGFRQTLARDGCDVRLLAPGVTLSEGAWEPVRAALVRDLRKIDGPLGVLAFNDYDAALVEDAALSAGLRVPDDVGILGVDDNELVVNCLPVPLSSVRLDLERIGYEGAALLERLMDGAKPPTEPTLIPPRGIAERASTDATPAADPLVREALVLLRERFPEKLTTHRVAALCGVTGRALETAFRREGGLSLHQRLMEIRLRAVCRRLRESAEPIDQIARSCGFSHGPHLHAEFRRRFRCSPRFWRVEHLRSLAKIQLHAKSD